MRHSALSVMLHIFCGKDICSIFDLFKQMTGAVNVMWISLIWLILLGVWMTLYFHRYKGELVINRKRLAIARGLSALVAVVICCRETSAGQAVMLISLAFFLPAIAVIDYENKIIPNCLLMRLAVTGILGYIIFFLTERENFLYRVSGGCLTGLGLFAVLLLVALLSKGLGGGDVKLFGLIGCMSGYGISISVLFWGLMCSMFAAVILLIKKKKGKKDILPFGPFILAGYLISVAALYL